MLAGCGYTSPQNTQPAHINGEYLVKAENAVQKTLEEMKNNADESAALISTKRRLNQIARHCNIFDIDAVKSYIAHLQRTDTRKDNLMGKPIGKGFKQNMVNNYVLFCRYNNIDFPNPPKYKYQAPAPSIPRLEDVKAIIMHSAKDFIAVFSIMLETAAEGNELHITHLNDMDLSGLNAKIKITGVKQHNNGEYLLTEDTSNMLKELVNFRVNHRTKHHLLTEMNRDPTIYPFPTSKTMGEAWRSARRRAAKKLCKPHLDTIELKSIRNLAGAIYYTKTAIRDPIALKDFMRHKKLEQTMHYLSSLKTFTASADKVGKIVKTADEAMELILQGYHEEAIYYQGTPNEQHILTKLKY